MQRLQVIRQCIIPGITYAFPIMPLKLHDLDRLDSLIAKCAKKAFGLAGYAPNALIHASSLQGGMGIQSLRVHYYQANLSALVKALNDNGPLGLTTRHLMQHQLQALQGLNPKDVPAAATHLRLAKQMAMAEDIGMCLTDKGSLYHTVTSELVRLLRTITYDPIALGLRVAIPPKVYHPLMQLGIDSLACLTTSAGKYMISTTDMRLRYGKAIRPIHFMALNRLTLLLNAQAPDGLTMPQCTTAALPREQRRIRRGHVAVELMAAMEQAPISKASESLYTWLRQAAQRAPDGSVSMSPSLQTCSADVLNTNNGPHALNVEDSHPHLASPPKPPATSCRRKRRKTTHPGPRNTFGKPDFVVVIDKHTKRETITYGDGTWGDLCKQLQKDVNFQRAYKRTQGVRATAPTNAFKRQIMWRTHGRSDILPAIYSSNEIPMQFMAE
jgi:hypothetical protein